MNRHIHFLFVARLRTQSLWYISFDAENPFEFTQASGNTHCGLGTSKRLTDFGGGWSLEDCQYNCFKIDGCTDIIFAKDNGHCNTFAGCENAGEDSVWQHYKLQGTDLSNESKYSVLFSVK